MKKLNKIARFLDGVSSIICLFPQENKRQITLPTSVIYVSLKNDWEKIGADMWQAVQTIESQSLDTQQDRNNNDRFTRYSE
ncbi:MAG TPA: hypothetical protein VJL60_01230 [Gammaproteobacteria bacterium]|nr:hypothetical protein [Gammaproteobacteria bacterium]